MKETRFIEQNKAKWESFEHLLQEKDQQPEDLSNMFIQITDDLSYARTFYPRRSVRMYLNGLAQRVFNLVYKGKRFPSERFKFFWTTELPSLLWLYRKAMVLGFLVFFLAFLIGVISNIINPEFGRVILGDGYVDMTLENIKNNDPMAVYKDDPPLGMSIGIALNNLYVSFLTAITGVLASIGTLFFLLYNGIMVGSFQTFFFQHGTGLASVLTIWIHGTLEISAIIMAGGAGLVAGSGLLFPGTYTRIQAFQLSIRAGLKILAGIAPIIILAAFFEGFFTRYTETPALLRALFIGANLTFVLWYFVWYPYRLFRNVPDQKIQKPTETLAPANQTGIDYQSIKQSGEIFGDTFFLVGKYVGPIIKTILAISLALVGVSWLISTEPFNAIFYERMDSFGKLSQFIVDGPVPMLIVFQVSAMVGLALWLLRLVALDHGDITTGLSSRTFLLVVLSLGLGLVIYYILSLYSALFLQALLAAVCLPVWAIMAGRCYFVSPDVSIPRSRIIWQHGWRSVISLGFMFGVFSWIMLLLIQTQMVKIILQLFAWMAPPGSVATVSPILYFIVGQMIFMFIYALFIISGALLFFSNKEAMDAAHLYSGIETVGKSRAIRGIAKE